MTAHSLDDDDGRDGDDDDDDDDIEVQPIRGTFGSS